MWSKERLNETEEMCMNPAIDKSVLQVTLLNCVAELKRLHGFIPIPQNVGKKIKITGNSNEHKFGLGDIVVIVDFEDFDLEDAENGVEAASEEGGEHWFVRHTDYELIIE